MAKLWHFGDEQSWLKAIDGDAAKLQDAFEWSSTEEGGKYWDEICLRGGELPQEIRDRVAYLYAEWKLLGDTDDRLGDKDVE